MFSLFTALSPSPPELSTKQRLYSMNFTRPFDVFYWLWQGKQYLKLVMHPHALAGSQYQAQRGILRNMWQMCGVRQSQLLEKLCCISKIIAFICVLTLPIPSGPSCSLQEFNNNPEATERSKQSHQLELEPCQGKVASSPLQIHLSPLGSPTGCTVDRLGCSSSEPLPSSYSMGLNSIYHICCPHKAVSCDRSSAVHKESLGYRCSVNLC